MGVDSSVLSQYMNPCVLAIANGTVLSDKVTNGGVIQAIFPGKVFGDMVDGYINNVECILGRDTHTMYFGEEWWNSPYREETKEQKWNTQ